MTVKKNKLIPVLLISFSLCVLPTFIKNTEAAKRQVRYQNPDSFNTKFNTQQGRHQKFTPRNLGSIRIGGGSRNNSHHGELNGRGSGINIGDIFKRLKGSRSDSGRTEKRYIPRQQTQPRIIWQQPRNIRYPQPQQQFIQQPQRQFIQQQPQFIQQQPQPQFIQQQPQPIVQQQPVAPQPILQAVEPLKNEIVALPTEPVSNSFNLFDVPSDAQLQKTAEDLMDGMVQDSDELISDQEDIVQEKAEALDLPNGTKQEDVTKLENAIADSDIDEVDKLAEKMKLDKDQVKALTTEMDVRNKMQDMNDLVNDGASTRKIKRAANDLLDAMDNRGPGNNNLNNQQIDKLDQIIATSEAIDTVEAIIGSQNANQMPNNFQDVILIPGLPNGSVAVAPGGNLIYGTGNDGELQVLEGGYEDVLGMAIPTVDPVADMDEKEDPATDNAILLINPASSKVTINYNVDGSPFKMEPGFTQTLNSKSGRLVEFDRGLQFGKASYSLQKGTYKFKMTNKGWELYSQTFESTIDNSKNKIDFNYVFENKQLTIKAGEKKTHSSSYPVVIQFDRGDGGSPVGKQLETETTYFVGLDLSKKRLELFPASDKQDLIVQASYEKKETISSRKSVRDRTSKSVRDRSSKNKSTRKRFSASRNRSRKVRTTSRSSRKKIRLKLKTSPQLKKVPPVVFEPRPADIKLQDNSN